MKLNQKQQKQLADVLNHVYIDEEKHFCEHPLDDGHIFFSIKALSDVLIAFNQRDCCLICGTVTAGVAPSPCGNPCRPAEKGNKT